MTVSVCALAGIQSWTFAPGDRLSTQKPASIVLLLFRCVWFHTSFEENCDNRVIVFLGGKMNRLQPAPIDNIWLASLLNE